VKELIVKNQTAEDTCVLNYEDAVLREFGKTITPEVIYFSSERSLEEGICLEGDEIVLRDNGKEIPVVRTGELKLLGKHNFENVMAAVAMTYAAGVPMESIRKSICEFTAVEHRIEYVTEKNGVAYYNDSKGTNPDAAIKGIQAMNRPTLLIGGGYDKESSYDEWINAFDGKVRYLVLIGQTKEKIRDAANRLGFDSCVLCEDLKEAVEFCASHANEGDAVLLSPACASWGQFDNYEQRGDMFKQYVREL
jgi:UDP-N-acetylmuramoylalanine--D-glutamate ligase